jgi:hypothetical protein
MADTLSYQEAEKLIRENPKLADALASSSHEYFKTHPGSPPTDIPKSILDGKSISEAYPYLRERDEDLQMKQTGKIDSENVSSTLAGIPILAGGFLASSFLAKPKIMENDGEYKKIEKTLKNEWLKKNNAKDFSSKEGLDYLYGNLDGKTESSLHREAEKIFREDPKLENRVKGYDKQKKKVYKNLEDDPAIQNYRATTQAHTSARLEYLKTHDDNATSKEVTDMVQKKSLEDFATKYPEKTKAYGEKIEGLQGAQFKIQTREDLAAYAATSGKDIRYVEKAHRDSSGISTSEANKILEGISNYREEPPIILSSPISVPPISVPIQGQGRQSSGGITRGINSINSLMRGGIKNPLGGSKIAAVAKVAAKGFIRFIAANPWIWAVFVTAFVSVVTFFTDMFFFQ